MIIPVRCYTCGAVIGDKWEEFEAGIKAGKEPGKVLDELGVRRFCCRRMLLTHVDIIREVVHYSRPV